MPATVVSNLIEASTHLIVSDTGVRKTSAVILRARELPRGHGKVRRAVLSSCDCHYIFDGPDTPFGRLILDHLDVLRVPIRVEEDGKDEPGQVDRQKYNGLEERRLLVLLFT